MRLSQIYLTVLLSLCVLAARGQNYAVRSTVQLVPPYSVYLSDYATAGSDKMRVILQQGDLSRPVYQLRLVMSVSLNGKVIMRTSRFFNPAPITLDPGIPTVIAGAELAPYVDSRNIDFVGYSKDQYEKTKALPEGAYEIVFTAFDYRRQDQQVSNAGMAFYYLAKNEPPLLNFPACGTKIALKTPQQIVFSWLPRNTSSPNSSQETEYEFALYETRPVGRNPNDVVLSSQPVYRQRTDYTQLIYGPAEPMLLDGMVYVWRIQAIDRSGKDAFRNNGYSEVCTFTYGGSDPDFSIGIVKGLQAEGETDQRGKVWWERGPGFDAYKVYYKKSGAQWQWFSSEVTTAEYKIFDLEPDNEYEVRVQGKKDGYYSPFTDIVKFRTREQVLAHCGDPAVVSTDLGEPLQLALTGMTIKASDHDVTFVRVENAGQPGWFKGTATVTLPYLGGTYFVTFERLYVNENRVATGGKLMVASEGIAKMIEEQLGPPPEGPTAPEGTAPQQPWAGTDFYEEIIEFPYDIQDITVDASGNLVITQENGQVVTDASVPAILVKSPEKAVIIEDKNGDQYVVQKDKDTGATKVTKVEGGGLSPGGSAGTNMQADPIKDRIVVLILEQFEGEIAAWLRINGKGGEDDPDVYLAEELPRCFPGNANILEHINESTIPYFKDHPAELRGRIESDQTNKILFNKIAKLFSNADAVTWNNVPKEDAEALKTVTCSATVEADIDVLETEFTAKVGSQSSKSCLMQGWERGKQLYGEYDAGIAIYAGFIKFLICQTEKENCGSGSVSSFSCGITNGLLQELDWIVFLEGEGITKEDIAKLILCVKDSYPIGGRIEDNPDLYRILFKCITGVELGDMGNAIKDFIIENWDEAYYQGQATAFVVTLISPYKAKIIDKLRTLPKYVSKITKFESLAKAKNADELVSIAKSLSKGKNITTLRKLTSKASSVEIPWKNLDDKSIIWANPNNNTLHTAKTFANETGASLYDVVFDGGYYVKFDLSDGRVLLGNTSGNYHAFAIIDDASLGIFKSSILNVTDDVFNSKLGTFLEDHANKLQVLSGATSRTITIAGKTVNLSSSKVNTILGRFRPDVKNLFNELGSYKNVGLGEIPGGINLLNKPDYYYDASTWWNSYNKPWLDKAIVRRDDIYLATVPQNADEVIKNGDLLGAYAEELNYLAQKNYRPTNLTLDQWSTLRSWLGY